MRTVVELIRVFLLVIRCELLLGWSRMGSLHGLLEKSIERLGGHGPDLGVNLVSQY